MTTPVPGTSQGTVSGLLGNLLGGAAGSLAGPNVLQQSLDQLTNAVNSLTNQISSSNFGGGTIGQATRQQGAGRTQPFPRMQNPFQPQGGGGNANLGQNNITQPNTFGSFANRSGFSSAAGALMQFGQNQMNPLLTLNQYATSSQLGMNPNGMSQQQALAMLYRQAGVTPGRLNTIAFSAQDAIGSVAPLQQLGGTMNAMASNLGRAGFQATAAFGITNPTLGATQSAQLAQALYSPQFSQNMLALGYNPIRSMKPGGAPLGAGQAAQSILQGLGLNKMSPANLYGNLSSGRGQAALSALFGSSGISNSQAATFLEGYNQLFSKGVSANKANQLFQQAMSGNLSQAKSAQAQLNKYGVATSANDISAMKTSQSVVTGRESTYAGGFNSAIQDSTGLLEKFNSVLTSILQATGLGGGMGFAGGFSGVLSGTSHGVGMGMGMGGMMMGARMLGLGGGAAGGGAAAGATALSGLATTLAAVAAPLAAAALAWEGLAHGGAILKSMGIKNVAGLGSSQVNQENTLKAALKAGGMSASHSQHIQHVLAQLGAGQSFSNSYIQHLASPGGGSAGMSTSRTSQSKTGGNNMQGGISGSAKSAVSAAESQVGVPYVFGDEIPGVGFDCSGLTQWAYKQAGVSLPRTSQAQWAALKKRRVPLNQVQEGDLVFAAGADGSPNSPGHVGMMVNGKQVIQAPHQGQSVQLSGYNPNSWAYAARPSGSGSFIAGNTASASGMTGANTASGLVGNRGLGGSGGSQYGSANEVDLISAMGAASGGSGGSLIGSGGNGSGASVNGNGTSGKAGSIAGISGGGGTAANKRLMKQLAQAMYGWGSGSQWNALNTLEMHEAGYNQFAQNPTSTAFGIGQFLNSTWSGFGPKTSNPKLQIQYMLEYIKGRYGTPVKAWDQYYQHPGGAGWYGEGGMVQPGMSIVGERGPEIMMTSGGKSQVFSNSQTMALINQIKGNVPQNPWKTDVTSGSSSASHASSRPLEINFNQGSIVIHSSNSESVASKAGREVARQVVRHLNSEAVSQAIRNGEKL